MYGDPKITAPLPENTQRRSRPIFESVQTNMRHQINAPAEPTHMAAINSRRIGGLARSPNGSPQTVHPSCAGFHYFYSRLKTLSWMVGVGKSDEPRSHIKTSKV